MLIPFDYSLTMANHVITIDQDTFCDIPYSPEDLIARMKSTDNYFLYLYYQDEEPLGYIGLMLVQNLHYRAFWVDLIAVDPKYQNQNFAQQMISDAKLLIQSEFNDIEFISALVRQDNLSSLGAFQAQGFSEDAPMGFKLLFYNYSEEL